MSYFPGSPPGRSALDRVTPVRADFWRDCDVFVTGHTGFKGAWLAVVPLTRLGARVHGYALETPDHFLFHRADVRALLASDVRGDIRDAAALETALRSSGADVVLHLAAQSIVRASYVDPRETFSSNVDGTVAVLDVARSVEAVTRCVVVTTDKVYENRELVEGGPRRRPAGRARSRTARRRRRRSYRPRRRAALWPGGTSTRCVPSAPATSSGAETGPPASARPHAGAPHRRAGGAAQPGAMRPWEHVLEPLNGYLLLGQRLHGRARVERPRPGTSARPPRGCSPSARSPTGWPRGGGTGRPGGRPTTSGPTRPAG